MEGCLVRALLFLLPTFAWADAVNNEWHSTARSLTMGNVGIASAEDPTTAMFYNPAALSRTKKTSFEFFNPQLEVGMGNFKVGGGTDIARHTKLSSVRPLLEKKAHKVSSMGYSLYPNLGAQNFNFGILLRGEGASYHDGTKLHYKSKYFIIPTMGISISFLSGRFRLGFAGRGIQATENNRSATAAQTDVGYTVDASEGFGLGLDAGALLSLPWAGLPTFGLVARNVGDTTFTEAGAVKTATGTVTRKEKVKMTYDAGFSLSPRSGKSSGMVFAVDYRDVLNQYEVSRLRRVNIGMEFNYYKVVYFRLGYGRGYWTGGIGLGSRLGSIDLGTYSEELDDKKLRIVEDRRIVLRVGRKF